jgi:hypothetical protein
VIELRRQLVQTEQRLEQRDKEVEVLLLSQPDLSNNNNDTHYQVSPCSVRDIEKRICVVIDIYL